MTPLSGERSAADRAGEFDGFFDRESLLQMRRATLLLGSEAEAADIVQESFARVWQRWDDLDDPGPYLNRVVLNLCRDHARRRQRHLGVLPRLARSQVGGDEHEILDDVLARLPFRQRAAVVLRYWGGLSNGEIAEELGCAPGSVGPWIRRALDSMAKELR